MPLVLRIENVDNLPDGGPVFVEIDRRGIDIGRDTYLDWTLPDPERFISGKHCEIHFREGGYWLHDVSTNGTTINNNPGRLTEPHCLAHGDRIHIGPYIVMAELSGVEAGPDGPGPIPTKGGTSFGGDPWGGLENPGGGDRPARLCRPQPGEHRHQKGRSGGRKHIVGIRRRCFDPAITPESDWSTKPASEPPASDAADWGAPACIAAAGSIGTARIDTSCDHTVDRRECRLGCTARSEKPASGGSPWDVPSRGQPDTTCSGDTGTTGRDANARASAYCRTRATGRIRRTQSVSRRAGSAGRACSRSRTCRGRRTHPSCLVRNRPANCPVPEEPEPAAVAPPVAPERPIEPAQGLGEQWSAGAAAEPAPQEPAPQQPVVQQPAPRQPALQQPAAAPVEAPAVAAGTPQTQNVVEAFERGAGLPAGSVSGRSDEQFAEELGHLFRSVTQSLQAMLLARAETKSAMRSTERTMIGALENNPLKFSPTPEDAMRIMFGQKTRSYLDATQTVEQSFADLQKHQMLTFGAMQSALQVLIEDLDPENHRRSDVQGRRTGRAGQFAAGEAVGHIC